SVETRAPEVRLERLSYIDLHQRLLEKYAAPSVVVNEEFEIVHLSEKAGRYMQISGGEATTNVLKLIRPELRLELRTALYQATHRKQNVDARNLELSIDQTSERLNLLVRPVFGEDATRGFILVLFEPINESLEQPSSSTVVSPAEPIARQLE